MGFNRFSGYKFCKTMAVPSRKGIAMLLAAACVVPAGTSQWETTRQGWPVLMLPGDEGLSRDEISHRARVKKVEAEMVR